MTIQQSPAVAGGRPLTLFPSRFSLALAGLALVLVLASPPLAAHGGEDHGAEDHAAPVAAMQAQPRASAVSEQFELVLVAAKAEGHQQSLQIYLSQFADNSPVSGASIEVESIEVESIEVESIEADNSAFQGKAKAVAPGHYQLTVPALSPAKYALTFTVETADTLDLLSTELDLTPATPAMPVAEAELAGSGLLPGWLGLLLLLGGIGAGWSLKGRFQAGAASPVAKNMLAKNMHTTSAGQNADCCTPAGNQGGGACH